MEDALFGFIFLLYHKLLTASLTFSNLPFVTGIGSARTFGRLCHEAPLLQILQGHYMLV